MTDIIRRDTHWQTVALTDRLGKTRHWHGARSLLLVVYFDSLPRSRKLHWRQPDSNNRAAAM